MFEKAAEGQSYRKICHWLRQDLDFKSPHDKYLSLSTVQLIISKTFYYGRIRVPARKQKFW